MALPDLLDQWREVIHPAALILPRPDEAEYRELKESIAKNGLLQPLGVFVDSQGEGWLIDGVSRLQILVELDRPVLNDGQWLVETKEYREDEGVDPYEIAFSLNFARRHLTTAQKHEVIRALRAERPDLTERALARMAGVSPGTVARAREEPEPEPEPAPEANGHDVEEETGEDEAPKRIMRPRVESTGRRARGRRPGQQYAEPAADEGAPFAGTVLPNAPKSARIAEVRRCAKHLGLRFGDLPKR